MNRRRFLGAVGLAGLAASAGCYEHIRHWDEHGDVIGPQPSLSDGDDGASDDGDVGSPSNRLRRGAAKDGIPAITGPVFATDWSSVEETLGDDELVVGVDIEGDARAYPLAILNWHEVVNDVFEPHSDDDAEFGGSLLVTYCPLCGSGVVVDRTVAGAVRTFGVSGLLWQSGLVLYDVESESLWNQLSATAIRGPLTGTALTRLPSTIATWGEWRREHPDTTVLLPPPASDTVKGWQSRDYDWNPYVGYDRSERVGVGDSRNIDGRLHPKTMVVGVTSGVVARAYPLANVVRSGVVNDTVGTLPVVIATSVGLLVAYDRRVDGRALDFERDGNGLVAGGSRWSLVSGSAVDGPHEGTQLVRVNNRSPLFWFAWANLYPETEIYGNLSE